MKPINLIIAFTALSIIFICPKKGFSVIENSPAGARSASLGFASVSLNDFWSLFNNQAGLVGTKGINTGVGYSNRFLLQELGTKYLGLAFPTKYGVFGLGYSGFGYSNYSQDKLGLAYAKKLNERFSAGLQLDYLSTRIAEDYGKAYVLSFELGMMMQLSDEVIIAAHIFNPLNSKLENKFNERISSVYRLGISYKITDDFLLLVETKKDMNYKPQIMGGFEYSLAEKLAVRLGLSSIPSLSGADKFSIASLYTFGFGLELDKLQIDFGASVHQVLGWSPHISMTYEINKRK
ncbi:MAG: hypothetical protein K9G76_10260 [Bacteroidales bacterium]|nr:hypothetical protein [Bacteroidales bacterium]MCF8405220.1 hypothetical protein [Bacteroidales bacterium]